MRKEKVPLLFDYHHHKANEGEEPLDLLLPRIFDTWKHIGLKPKVHISSPKSEKNLEVTLIMSQLISSHLFANS